MSPVTIALVTLIFISGSLAIGYVLEWHAKIEVSQADVWRRANDVKIDERYIGKPFIFITKKDFDAMKPNFVREWNWMHIEPSYRTREAFLHIHAIDFGDTVGLHRDRANPALFKPLAILHFFFDFPPYFAYCWAHDIAPFEAFRPTYLTQT